MSPMRIGRKSLEFAGREVLVDVILADNEWSIMVRVKTRQNFNA